MSGFDVHSYSIWVLFPAIETDDENLQYYYDFSTAVDEYTRAFQTLGCDWNYRYVLINTIETILDDIKQSSIQTPLIINLCDGDETNGVPGISVIRELEKRQMIFTGADEFFFDITTSKIPMKRAFDEARVPTAAWEVVDEQTNKDLFTRLGFPLIVKPAVSGGSMGLTVRNVVSTGDELRECLNELHTGYRGWNLEGGGILAEKFIAGREFTTFIVGRGDTIHFYKPAERIFHHSLPENERFLSFDRLWETYETEDAMPGDGFVYHYAEPEEDLYEELKELSIAAYNAVGGCGYARLDIRQDSSSKKLFVLEVNAQCGLSEDENYTSIGAILRFTNESFATLTERIMEDALLRAESFSLSEASLNLT